MYSYDRRASTEPVASGGEDAVKILALFKKTFKYVSVDGHASGRNVVFSFEIEDGLFQKGAVTEFATALRVNPKKVTLPLLQP